MHAGSSLQSVRATKSNFCPHRRGHRRHAGTKMVARRRRNYRHRRRYPDVPVAQRRGDGTSTPHRLLGYRDENMEIVGAIRLRKEIDNEWLLGASGVVSVIFGLLLLSRPAAGALALITVISAFAIVHGILLVWFSLRLRGGATPLLERLGEVAAVRFIGALVQPTSRTCCRRALGRHCGYAISRRDRPAPILE